jgi:hypothetical protein
LNCAFSSFETTLALKCGNTLRSPFDLMTRRAKTIGERPAISISWAGVARPVCGSLYKGLCWRADVIESILFSVCEDQSFSFSADAVRQGASDAHARASTAKAPVERDSKSQMTA